MNRRQRCIPFCDADSRACKIGSDAANQKMAVSVIATDNRRTFIAARREVKRSMQGSFHSSDVLTMHHSADIGM